MRVLSGILLVLLVVVAATVAVLVLGSGSETGPAMERPSSGPPLVPGPGELVAELRALKHAVEQLTARLDNMAKDAPGPEAPAEAPPGPTDEPKDMQIAELTAAIRELVAAQRATPPSVSSAPRLRWIVEQQPVLAPQDSLGRYKNQKDAVQGLMFKDYEQVLRELGRPTEIGIDGNSLQWFYDCGEVTFVDGFVVRVQRYEDE